MAPKVWSQSKPAHLGSPPAGDHRDGLDKEQLDPQTSEAIRETFHRFAVARQPMESRRRASIWRRTSTGFLRHWLLVMNLAAGVFVTMPWLAPPLMQAGQVQAAGAIYLVYSTQCHQLPQRSFFLFGEKSMYSLAEIRSAWRDTMDPTLLRQFVGNPQMGWKVAWSDRMVSMYTSLFLAGLAFALVRKRLRPLPIWAFALFILPLAIDGSTHFVSDLAGLGNGFRDTNSWLAALAGDNLPGWFSAGDGVGSLNSWMRLLTGTLLGVALVWLGYPRLDALARDAVDTRAPLAARPILRT